MNELLNLCKNQDKEYEQTVYTLQHKLSGTEPEKLQALASSRVTNATSAISAADSSNTNKLMSLTAKNFHSTSNHSKDKDYYQVHAQNIKRTICRIFEQKQMIPDFDNIEKRKVRGIAKRYHDDNDL